MIQGYLKKQAEYIDSKLKELLPAGRPEILFKAIEYSLSAGGKRIRPVLVIESAKSVDNKLDSEHFKEILVAVEFIHTYSLIHDDLPAMDDDDFRRGKPTCHKVFGEAMAILTGDGMLTHAFNLISSNKKIEASKILKIINILSEKTGLYGMVAGQAGDILEDFEDIQFIHSHKTAKFVQACCEIGAILADANPKQFESLSEYGFNIGMAFQIWDDILDEIGDETKLGKKVHKDKEKNKITYPAVYGVEKSKEMAIKHIETAINSLKGIPNRDILVEIAKFIISREV